MRLLRGIHCGIVGNRLWVHPLPDFSPRLAWALLPEFPQQPDSGRYAVEPRTAAAPWLGQQQRPKQSGNAVFQLGLGFEQLAVLPVQFSGKPGDFLAHGRGQGWGDGSAARS